MEPEARTGQTRADYEILRGLFLSLAYEDDETLLRVIWANGLDVNVADPSGKTLLLSAVDFAAQCADKMRVRMAEGVGRILPSRPWRRSQSR